jgi:hypothetical protein
MPSEERTARLSVLIDPKKKACFEALCKQDDVTPSQVVRQLIRAFIESRLGPNWPDQVLGDPKLNIGEELPVESEPLPALPFNP